MIPGFIAGGYRHNGVPPAVWTPYDMATPPPIWVNELSAVAEVAGAASSVSNIGTLAASGDFNQTSAPSRPVLASGLAGMRTLIFDGIDDRLTCGSPAAKNLYRNVAKAYSFFLYKKTLTDSAGQDRVMFAVSRNTGTAVRWRNLCGSVSGANKNQIGVRRLDSDPGWTADSTSASSGTWGITAFIMDYIADDVFIYRNGAVDYQSLSFTGGTGPTSNTASASDLYLGCQTNNSSFADFELAECLFGSVLAPGEVDKVFGYLAHKWGLQSLLPAGHPYKTTAP